MVQTEKTLLERTQPPGHTTPVQALDGGRGGIKTQLRALDYAAGARALEPGAETATTPVQKEASNEHADADAASDGAEGVAVTLDPGTQKWRVRLDQRSIPMSEKALAYYEGCLGTPVVQEPSGKGYVFYAGEFDTKEQAEALLKKAAVVFSLPEVVAFDPTAFDAAALATLVKTEAVARAAAWAALSNEQRASATTLIAAGALADDVLESLFKATPESDLAAVRQLFEVRFGVTVGQVKDKARVGLDFDAAGLRRTWDVLVKLPDAHVRGSALLDHWTRYDGGGISGGFQNDDRKEVSHAYTTETIATEKNTGASKGDPLYQVCFFDQTVRHEIGHAIDASVGGEAYAKSEKGGDWTVHGAADLTLVETMVAKSGGAISKLSDPTKTMVMFAIMTAMRDATPDKTEQTIRALALPAADGTPSRAKLDEKTLAAVLADPVVTTATTAGWGKAPWYYAPGMGTPIDKRHYQAIYQSSWASYATAALDRKVSEYQFRSPKEWFAEAYATYFEPDANGKVGTLLAGRDADTKKWFDDNVLPKEKKKEGANQVGGKG